MDSSVRHYTPVDVEACRELWAELVQAHRDLYDDPTIGGDDPGLHFDEHLERAGADCLWVAEVAGKVVGLGGLVVHGSNGEVDPVVVSAGHRNGGIGTALVRHIVEDARRRGLRRLRVRPVARNKRAIRLYHCCGFDALGCVEMILDLADPPPVKWRDGTEFCGRRFKY